MVLGLDFIVLLCSMIFDFVDVQNKKRGDRIGRGVLKNV